MLVANPRKWKPSAMFLPIADSPNPSSRPIVTWGLLLLNLAVYLAVSLPLSLQAPAMNDPVLPEYLRTIGVQGPVPFAMIRDNLTAYDLVVFKYGFKPATGGVIPLFTALFLHAGFFHLAGNMLFLYIFGDNVEHRLGAVRYLCAYLFFGVAATLFFSVFVPGSNVPLIGASGAISGLMGCYFLWFPRNQVKIFVFLFPFIVTTFMIPSRWVLGFYLLIDNLLPFLVAETSESGVAHGAHIGGFLAGLGLVFAADHLSLARRPGTSSGRVSAGATSCTPQCVAEAAARGDLVTASRCYLELEQASQRAQVAADQALSLGDYLLSQGDMRNALRIFRRFIAERPSSPGLDRAYLSAGNILLQNPRYATSAYHYLLAAIDLASSPAIAAEARTGIARIEAMQRRSGRPLLP
jgi:membrane associated rhomboid family serine protease